MNTINQGFTCMRLGAISAMASISSKKTDDVKSLIYYHRAYKKLANPGKHILLRYFLLTAPFTVTTFFLFSELTHVMNDFARYSLSFILPIDTIELIDKTYLLREVIMIDFPTRYAKPTLSFGLFLFSLLTVLVVTRVRIAKPVAMWIIFLSVVNLSASIFFILFPSVFPYDTKQFTELYIMTEINIWFLIPFITGMALLPLPSSTFSKFTACAVTLLYSVIFGILRYAVFLIVVSKASFLFMSVLFFAFGPLMDFFYIVGIYSYYLSVISIKAKVDLTIWKWSY